jgi:hypothetical protein
MQLRRRDFRQKLTIEEVKDAEGVFTSGDATGLDPLDTLL